MTDTAQCNVRLPVSVIAALDELAERHEMSRNAMIRRAIGFAQAFYDEAASGRYVGAATDRESLDTVILAPR